MEKVPVTFSILEGFVGTKEFAFENCLFRSVPCERLTSYCCEQQQDQLLLWSAELSLQFQSARLCGFGIFARNKGYRVGRLCCVVRSQRRSTLFNDVFTLMLALLLTSLSQRLSRHFHAPIAKEPLVN